MTDLLFQVGFSNVFLSFILAIAALIAGITIKRPQLAHILWLLVLVKLVTPPLFTIPVIELPEQLDSVVFSRPDNSRPAANFSGFDGDAIPPADTSFAFLDSGMNIILAMWILGSIVVFGISLVRVFRFNAMLKSGSETAPQEIQDISDGIAYRLKLKRVPLVSTTSAHISPMIWWLGRKVRIIIPAQLIEEMDSQQFHWILAHELAHVRRMDYLVRWIEWLAYVCFWWNPVVWWARYNLRMNEELCCDALVVSSLKPKPITYADSLLKAVVFLTGPVIPTPAMASEISGGGFLEERFRRIVSDDPRRSNSLLLQACFLVCALGVLLFNFGCQDNSITSSPGIENTEVMETSGTENDFSRLGVSVEWLSEIKTHLSQSGLTAEQIEPALDGVFMIAQEMQSEGDIYIMTPSHIDNMRRNGLTDEQIELVQGIAQRVNYSMNEANRERSEGEREETIDDYYLRVGMSAESIAGIRSSLSEQGFSDAQTEIALTGMTRVIYQMQAELSEGGQFELDPNMREYFMENGFTDEQIDTVIGISRRIEYGMRDADRERGEREQRGR